MSLEIFNGFFALFASLLVLAYILTYALLVFRRGEYRMSWYLPLLLMVAIRFACEGVFCFADGMGASRVLVLSLAVISFISGNGIFQCFLHFISERVDFPQKRRFLIIVDVLFLAVAAVIAVQAFHGVFFDYQDGAYIHTDLYWLLVLVIDVLIFGSLGIFLWLSKADRGRIALVLAFLLPPMIGNLLNAINPNLPWFVVGTFVSVQICNAVMYMDVVVEAAENKAMMARQEEELAKSTNLLMLSQIQPHFLYNTLGAIACLCDEKPRQAKELILRFSRYLRHNIKSLSEEGLVSFSVELGHTMEYLDIESVRFGERLRVKWLVDEVGFSLPSLVLQPLVENAVKHGIGPKRDGGTVTVSTRREPEGFALCVEDDGVGFDPVDLDAVSNEHFGLANIKNRLMLTCGGTLSVESEKGKGTLVTVRVPATGEESL